MIMHFLVQVLTTILKIMSSKINNRFRFKQFSVKQECSAMKVGTDGVLLGAWAMRECGSERVESVLDIGSGTGVISLVAAQYCSNATITAVEIEESSAKESKFNFDNSDWSSRMRVENCSLQSYVSDSGKNGFFDLIISNPPYFINSLKNPDLARVAARHTELLPYEDLVAGVDALLGDDGLFCTILPYKEAAILIALAAKGGLYLRKRMDVYGSSQSSITRSMMLFSRTKGDTATDSVVIRQGEGYSAKYIDITKELYLKF